MCVQSLLAGGFGVIVSFRFSVFIVKRIFGVYATGSLFGTVLSISDNIMHYQ